MKRPVYDLTISYTNRIDNMKYILSKPHPVLTCEIVPFQKTGFFGRFSEAKSHDAGDFGGEKFSTGTDSNGVKNDLQGFRGGIYTPGGIGGEGYPFRGINREDC
jgi:hypothetical protein